MIAVVICKGLILAVAAATLLKLNRTAPAKAAAPSVALLGIVTLLIAPATATYHFVLLWLPVGLMIGYLIRERRPVSACVILGLYALIGFFPYRITDGFEGRGGLTVLAYPRLWLLLAMFVAGVAVIRDPRPA
jgi:cellulose synthase/poly-beta-1,6-N-acetylglucosamine synthase-like glycosyltransferase